MIDSQYLKKQKKNINRIFNYIRFNKRAKIILVLFLIIVVGIVALFNRQNTDEYLNSNSENFDINTVGENLRKVHENLIENILVGDVAKFAKLGQKYPSKIEQVELVETIHIGNAFLNSDRVMHKNGTFAYIFNLKQGINSSLNYNIVRHAGTIYAMGSYELEFGSGKYIQNIVSAVNFMKKYCIKPAGGSGMLGIWSFDKIDGSKKQNEIALGAVGLGLVALLTTEKLVKETTPAQELQSLGEFILFMQKENGGFYSKYHRIEGKDDRFESLYYPGEAALALVMLYEYDGNEKWLIGSLKVLGFLAMKRLGKKDIEADHWALLATARIWPLYNKIQNPPVPKQLILNHAIQVCGYILYEGVDSLYRHGSFIFDGRTTPTATRLEGLQAALTIIPTKHSVFIHNINLAVKIGIQYLINAQVKTGPNKGMMQRGVYVLDFGMETQEELENFNFRLTEFRIDYNQHPQSAFIEYWKQNFKNNLQL